MTGKLNRASDVLTALVWAVTVLQLVTARPVTTSAPAIQTCNLTSLQTEITSHPSTTTLPTPDWMEPCSGSDASPSGGPELGRSHLTSSPHTVKRELRYLMRKTNRLMQHYLMYFNNSTRLADMMTGGCGLEEELTSTVNTLLVANTNTTGEPWSHFLQGVFRNLSIAAAYSDVIGRYEITQLTEQLCPNKNMSHLRKLCVDGAGCVSNSVFCSVQDLERGHGGIFPTLCSVDATARISPSRDVWRDVVPHHFYHARDRENQHRRGYIIIKAIKALVSSAYNAAQNLSSDSGPS